MLDALDRILAFRSSGYYSSPHSVRQTLHTYDRARQGAIKTKNYWDAAYIDGYENGLVALELEPAMVAKTPLYFVWGSDAPMLKFSEYMAELRNADALHKTAAGQARQMLTETGGLDPIHRPFLDIAGLVDAASKGRRNVL